MERDLLVVESPGLRDDRTDERPGLPPAIEEGAMSELRRQKGATAGNGTERAPQGSLQERTVLAGILLFGLECPDR